MRGTSFAGQVVCITGASYGIGAEMARQFAQAGARLALAARSVDRLQAVVAECRALGADTIGVPTDVTDEAACRAFIEAAVAHFGQLDVLVNNAGLGASGAFRDMTDLSVFERTMRVNFFGTVYCTAAALPHLIARRGRLVAISSLTGLAGVPKRTAYGATKHAMAGFFDSLRIELEGSGVSVTVVYPGFVLSEINQHALRPDGRAWGADGYKRRPGETMATDECVRQILRAVHARRRDLVMTWRGRVGRVLKLLSPSLVDRLAQRAIDGKQ
ncbi:MAG: SDR family oxidoreductase [Gemmatimonadaceae bacterium]|jgi:NAD(P)-dependent dehydrogenase (short-subunit alcohol dehydrogenase family)|nr:SDR family oxidoreductase [Gemmatimonadaceae bacterium]